MDEIGSIPRANIQTEDQLSDYVQGKVMDPSSEADSRYLGEFDSHDLSSKNENSTESGNANVQNNDTNDDESNCTTNNSQIEYTTDIYNGNENDGKNISECANTVTIKECKSKHKSSNSKKGVSKESSNKVFTFNTNTSRVIEELGGNDGTDLDVPLAPKNKEIRLGNKDLRLIIDQKASDITTKIMNQDTNSYEKIQIENSPPKQNNFNVYGLNDDQCILIGDFSDHPNIWVLNIQAVSWEKLKTIGPSIKNYSNMESVVYKYRNLHVIYSFGNIDKMLISFVKNNTCSYQEVALDENCPLPRKGHSLTLVKDKIYLFGGLGMNDFWILDVGADPMHPRWNRICNIEIPSPRMYHSSFEQDGSLYICGGFDFEMNKLYDIWKYDGMKWTQENVFTDTKTKQFKLPNGKMIENNVSNLLDTLVKKKNYFLMINEENKSIIRPLKKQNKKMRDLLTKVKKNDSNAIREASLLFDEEAEAAYMNEAQEMRSKFANEIEFMNNQYQIKDYQLDINDSYNLKMMKKVESLKQQVQDLANEKESRKNGFISMEKKLKERTGPMPENSFQFDASRSDSFNEMIKESQQIESDYPLACYYALQVAEYNANGRKIQNLQSRIERIHNHSKRTNQKISDIIEAMDIIEARQKEANNELEKWRLKNKRISNEISNLSIFINEISNKGTSNFENMIIKEKEDVIQLLSITNQMRTSHNNSEKLCSLDQMKALAANLLHNFP